MTAVSVPSPPTPFPHRIGRYELLLPLGTGGMATVYLARMHANGGFVREVALKVMHPHLRTAPEAVADLLADAQLAARIRHRNVVPVLDVGEDEQGVFLVMEYVPGASLVDLLRYYDGQLPVRISLKIACDALERLQAAHELTDAQGDPLGVVHRDVSPHNVLVGTDGVARLADFGIAKADSRESRTHTGIIKGKIAYMSPEQARGKPLDRRCDVWAAGVMVWELVTGQRMYPTGGDVMAIALKIVSETPPRASTVRDGLPAALDDAIAWALTPEVARRCPTAEAFRRALLEATEGLALATTEEVGAFVLGEVGDRLAELRLLAERTLQTRSLPQQASDELTPPGPIEPESTASFGLLRSRRGLVVVLAGGLLGTLGLVLAFKGPNPPPREPPEATSARAVASATPATTPQPSAAPPELRSTLSLHADRPIARLTVGQRRVTVRTFG